MHRFDKARDLHVGAVDDGRRAVGRCIVELGRPLEMFARPCWLAVVESDVPSSRCPTMRSVLVPFSSASVR